MWDVACHLLVHLKFVACSTLPSDVYKVGVKKKDVYKVEAYSFDSFLDDVRSCSTMVPVLYFLGL